VLFYPDSTFDWDSEGNVTTGTSNHGYGQGKGYAVLDWEGEAMSWPETNSARLNWGYWIEDTNINRRQIEWIVPNIGRGTKMIRFEFYAQYDPDQHTWSQNADTVYINLVGTIATNYNDYNANLTWKEYRYFNDPDGNARKGGPFQARPPDVQAGGNWQVFMGRDSIGGSWMQCVGVLEPPAWATLVHVGITKSVSLGRKAVRISDPTITWIDKTQPFKTERGPGIVHPSKSQLWIPGTPRPSSSGSQGGSRGGEKVPDISG
jgi:hypothetical protein